MYKVTKCLYFEAAHFLRGYEGACQNLHGHSYKLEITVESERLDELGMVVDFKKIKEFTQGILERYDHSCLNELSEYKDNNPTAEIMARMIYDNLKRSVYVGSRLVSVRVWETRDSYAEYTEE